MSDTLLELAVSGIAAGGAGLARDAGGRVILVEGGLPGEVVLARLIAEHRDYGEAVLAASPQTPSPQRVTNPLCSAFGRWPARGERPDLFCGGCQWQHVDYRAQLDFKAAIVRDCLRRQGRIADPPVRPTDTTGEPWGYRNHLRLHVHEGRPAFVAADGRHRVHVAECPIAHPRAWEIVRDLVGELPPDLEIEVRVGTQTGDRLLCLRGPGRAFSFLEVEVESDISVVIDRGRGLEVAAGEPYLVEQLGGREFRIPATAFFQANTLAAERLVGHVRELVGGPVETLIDGYSGVGTFATLLADQAREIYAIESDPLAVAAAADNAAGLEHIMLIEGTVEEALAELHLQADVAVVDPPRGGMEPEALRLLAAAVEARIIYVSCNPVTLGRDVRRLANAGWHLVECRPLDMFPQTYHIETVSLFQRQERCR